VTEEIETTTEQTETTTDADRTKADFIGGKLTETTETGPRAKDEAGDSLTNKIICYTNTLRA
jgi:hypothetical protein